MPRIVGEVGVHLKDVIVPALQRPFEPGDVGGSETELSLAMHRMDARVGAGRLVGHDTGTVRRVVVHDQDFDPIVLRQHLRHELRQGRRLVVGGNDD